MAPRKKKRRSAVVEIGTGPAKVRIHTINRKDGYDQHNQAWKEGDLARLDNPIASAKMAADE
jgi:hypothetical protein